MGGIHTAKPLWCGTRPRRGHLALLTMMRVRAVMRAATVSAGTGRRADGPEAAGFPGSPETGDRPHCKTGVLSGRLTHRRSRGRCPVWYAADEELDVPWSSARQIKWESRSGQLTTTAVGLRTDFLAESDLIPESPAKGGSGIWISDRDRDCTASSHMNDPHEHGMGPEFIRVGS